MSLQFSSSRGVCKAVMIRELIFTLTKRLGITTGIRKNGARSHMPIILILGNLRMVAVSSRLTSVL